MFASYEDLMASDSRLAPELAVVTASQGWVEPAGAPDDVVLAGFSAQLLDVSTLGKQSRGFWSFIGGLLAVVAIAVVCYFSFGAVLALCGGLGFVGLGAIVTAVCITAFLGAAAIKLLYDKTNFFKEFVDDCAPWLKQLSDNILEVAKEVGDTAVKVLKTGKEVLDAGLDIVKGTAKTAGFLSRHFPIILIGGVALWVFSKT